MILRELRIAHKSLRICWGRLAGLDGEFSRRAVGQDLDRRANFDAGILEPLGQVLFQEGAVAVGFRFVSRIGPGGCVRYAHGLGLIENQSIRPLYSRLIVDGPDVRREVFVCQDQVASPAELLL